MSFSTNSFSEMDLSTAKGSNKHNLNISIVDDQKESSVFNPHGAPTMSSGGNNYGGFPGGSQNGGFSGGSQNGGFSGGGQNGGFSGGGQNGGFSGGSQNGGFLGGGQNGGFPGSQTVETKMDGSMGGAPQRKQRRKRQSKPSL